MDTGLLLGLLDMVRRTFDDLVNCADLLRHASSFVINGTHHAARPQLPRSQLQKASPC